MKPRPPVRLEPELEALAGHLPPAARVVLAGKLFRWSRQLRISAVILSRRTPRRRPALGPLPAAKLRGN